MLISKQVFIERYRHLIKILNDDILFIFFLFFMVLHLIFFCFYLVEIFQNYIFDFELNLNSFFSYTTLSLCGRHESNIQVGLLKSKPRHHSLFCVNIN